MGIKINLNVELILIIFFRLAAAKSLLEEGIEPVVFEQSDSIGGVWLYKDVPDPMHPRILHASCYKSLTTNSSRFENTSKLSKILRKLVQRYDELFGFSVSLEDIYQLSNP